MRWDRINWAEQRSVVAMPEMPKHHLGRVVWQLVAMSLLTFALVVTAVFVSIDYCEPAKQFFYFVVGRLHASLGPSLSRESWNGLIAVVLGAVMTLGLMLPFIWIQLRHWRIGLTRMHQAIRSIAGGVELSPIILTGNCEIDHLLAGFNEMSARMRSDRNALIEVNEHLEDRVSERTKQWERASRDAEDASKAKSRFLATMSHEIRTPLNGVIGSLQLLERTQIDRQQQQIVRTGRLAAKSLLNLINDVLDLSAIEAGGLKLGYQRFVIEDVVNEAVAIVGPLANAKDIDVTFQIGLNVWPEWIGDPVRLRQILINLISNAVKFTDKGFVNIVVDIDRHNSDHLRFEVNDTGIGIAAEALAQLFLEFQQAGNDEGQVRGGTGLGLAICQRLVLLMGGQIGADSHVGLGSSFWFTACLTPVESRMLSDSEERYPKRILLCDSGSAVGRMMQRVLTGRGHMVVESKEILAKPSQLFDCVIVGRMSSNEPIEATIQTAQSAMANHGADNRVILLLTRDREDEIIKNEGLDAIVRSLNLPLATGELIREVETPDDQCDIGSDVIKVPNLSQLSVLVAEDNPANSFVMKNVLRAAGIGATFVETGQDAIAAVCTQRFDLILMDYRMPVMDGLATTRRIREMERSGDLGYRIPIIALTANIVDGEQNIFTEAGMDGVLTKPFEINDLYEVMQEIAKVECGSEEVQASLCPDDDEEYLIDMDALMTMCGNESDRFSELLVLLHKEFLMYERELRSIESNDAVTAERIGHRLAGCASQLGIGFMSKVARVLEEAESEIRRDVAIQLADMMEVCINQIIHLIERTESSHVEI